MDILKKCNLCPRNCNINRYLIKGACGADYKLKVAYSYLDIIMDEKNLISKMFLYIEDDVNIFLIREY